MTKSEYTDSDLLIEFAAGDPIFSQGESGDKMYIIASGEVEIVKGFGALERQLTHLEQGDFFGEISVLEGIPRTATAKALTDCRLLAIDVATFDMLLREHPEITVLLLRKLSLRLIEIDRETQRAHELAAGILADASPDNVEPINPSLTPDVGGPDSSSQNRKRERQQNQDEAPIRRRSLTSSVISPLDEISPKPPPSPPSQPVAYLIHTLSQQKFPVAGGRKNLIGRFDPASGKHPEIDLDAIDPGRSSSRRHARIWNENSIFYIQVEVGVQNQTLVGQRPLEIGRCYEIKDHDHLQLGLISLIFRTC